MPRIELIIDAGCPNVEAARELLREALTEAGIETEWTEWDRESDDSPAYARKYGSPTILVDGLDVSGQGSESDANCCRVYVSADGSFEGVPDREAVLSALQPSTPGA